MCSFPFDFLVGMALAFYIQNSWLLLIKYQIEISAQCAENELLLLVYRYAKFFRFVGNPIICIFTFIFSN